MYRKTYIEINGENLKHNVSSLIYNYPHYKYYIGVVKSSAYGHGLDSIKFLIEAGINYLAVSSLEEAIAIRNEKIDIPILCLQPIHIADIDDAIKYNITITISSLEYFNEFIKINFDRNIKIHLMINSGFNRLGISDKKDVLGIKNIINENKNLFLEGIYSHFATSGINNKYWDKQLQSFKEITSLIDLKEIPMVHFGRSLTILQHDKIKFCNGIRMGIIMYGYYRSPSKVGMLRRFIEKINKSIEDVASTYKPALKLYSEIIEIQKVKKGEFLGYGATFEVMKDSILGFIPIGYSDGFTKKNEGGFVFINKKRYEILKVDMNMTTIFIDEEVKTYDKVEFIGENISMYEVSRRNDISTYELLCTLENELPRIFIKNKNHL